jgi:hypothetical protein
MESPSPSPAPILTRRQWTGGLAAMLAAGLWPGRLCAAASQPLAGRFRWVVANDFHHANAECNPWMEALFRHWAQIEDVTLVLGLGDLADRGHRESLLAIRDLAVRHQLELLVCPGNHDLDLSPVEGFWSEVFPGQRNQVHERAGWRFILLDTTEGPKWNEVTIAAETLTWLDTEVPRLDPRVPTVVATHFPLAPEVRMCPLNAESLLARLLGLNLQGVFSGHFHGISAHRRGTTELVTNACVARVRGNHDGTTTKGYWRCEGREDGTLRREFVAWPGPAPA